MATKTDIVERLRVIMAASGSDRQEIAQYLGITPQALSNKMYRGSFSAEELLSVISYLGGHVVVHGDDWQLDLV